MSNKESLSLTDQQVTNYLHQHPDFFKSRQTLLEKLELPTNQGNVSSLISHQLSRLKEKNSQLELQAKEMVNNAKNNEALLQNIHNLVLSILDTDNLTTMADVLNQKLNSEFSVDVIKLCLIDIGKKMSKSDFILTLKSSDSDYDKYLKDITAQKAPICGCLQQEKLNFLFPKHEQKIKSTVILPIHSKKQWGILIIGSQDKDRFFSGLDTSFLCFLSQVLAKNLDRFLAT